MKKILFPTILMVFILCASTALALEPCPLAFNFETSPPDAEVGLHLEIYYNNELIKTQVVNEFGEAIIELGTKNIPNCIYQNFELIVAECRDHQVCHQTVSFNPSGYMTIDIRDAWLHITTTTATPTTAVTTTTYKECYTHDECMELCEDCECPEEFDPLVVLAAFFGLIGGGFAVYVSQGKLFLNKKSVENLIARFPSGCGLRIFKSYKGVSDLKHFHRSPKAYHTLDKRHKEKYDHEGEKKLFPDFGGG